MYVWCLRTVHVRMAFIVSYGCNSSNNLVKGCGDLDNGVVN